MYVFVIAICLLGLAIFAIIAVVRFLIFIVPFLIVILLLLIGVTFVWIHIFAILATTISITVVGSGLVIWSMRCARKSDRDQIYAYMQNRIS